MRVTSLKLPAEQVLQKYRLSKTNLDKSSVVVCACMHVCACECVCACMCIHVATTPKNTSLFLHLILLTIDNPAHIGTSKANFNCLYNPLTTIHLPYGLTLTSPVSEKGPLLSSRGEMGYYKLHTQGPLHSSGSTAQQLISSLTFIPQISVHKGAVFKCQVSYAGKDKIVEERVSEKFTILCKK